MGSALLPSGGFHLEGAAVPYVPYSRSGGEDREDEGGMDVGAGMPEGTPREERKEDDGFVSVFSRDNTSIRVESGRRISGRISLSRHKAGGPAFLSWLPYSSPANKTQNDGKNNAAAPQPAIAMASGPSTQTPQHETAARKTSSNSRHLYAVHPTALSEIHSVRRRAPPLGLASVTFVLHRNNETLPAFFFPGGGTKALLSALATVARLTMSEDDPTCYLINDLSDPLSRSLVGLDLASMGALPPAAAARTVGQQRRSATVPVPLPISDEQFTDAFAQGLSALLATAAAAASDLFGQGCDEPLPLPPPQPASPQHEQTLPTSPKAENGALGSFVVLGGVGNNAPASSSSAAAAAAAAAAATRVGPQALQPPVTSGELTTFLDVEGRLHAPDGLLRRVFRGGLAISSDGPHETCTSPLKRDVWALLLGLYPMNATPTERAEALKAKRQRYEALRMQWSTIDDLQARRFAKFRERRLQIEKDVPRTDSAHPYFNGMVYAAAEVEALGTAERERATSAASASSQEPDATAATPSAPCEVGSYSYELKKHRLGMLRGLLLTYSFYNFDLSYVQGMSDIAAVILSVFGHEADAFWCFVHLMEERADALAENFSSDENGMARQLDAARALLALADPELMDHLEAIGAANLFFLYRWILLRFKRELPSIAQTARLWEVASGKISATLEGHSC